MALFDKILLYIGVFLFIRILYIYGKNKFIDIKETQFLAQRKFAVWEIMIPTEIEKTPLAMENVFSIIHGTLIGPGPIDYNIYGIREYLYVWEIVGRNGFVNFYVNIPVEYTELVKSALYSNFPTIEVKEAEDWKNDLPTFDPDKKIYLKNGVRYRVKLSELILTKPDVYPIKSYVDFGFKEKFVDPEEEGRISDPLANVLEAVGSAGKDEIIVYQLLIQPATDDWKEEGLRLRDQMLGRNQQKKGSGLKGLFDDLLRESRLWLTAGIDRLMHLFTGGHIGSIEEQVKQLQKENEMFPQALTLSKREMEIIYAIERNISKLGFTTWVRIGYIAPQQSYNVAKYENLVYSFKQFNSQDLNGFMTNPYFYGESYIRLKHLLDLKTLYYIWWKYRGIILPINKRSLDALRQYNLFTLLTKKVPGKRKIGHKALILNTEELATIYHFPTKGVVAPYIKRIEAKRKRPPMGLPKTHLKS